EIATRANRLGMRERTMLIMVDDKTTRRDLLAKNSHPTSEGILNNLLADGYIEIASGAEPAAAPAALAPAATPEAAPGAPPVEVSLVSASRFACRALVTYLGPGADDLTALVEKCKNVADLTERLEKCRQVVQGMAGRKKADEFWAGVSARLPPA
ncbi:MAG: hypothetical protein Q8S20_18520, partial [Sulfuritalea sp.]|nr:hypothetical protein [Sulfuritalea sp.]